MTHYIHQTSKTNAQGRGIFVHGNNREASSSSMSKKEDAQMPVTHEEWTIQVDVQDWYMLI